MKYQSVKNFITGLTMKNLKCEDKSPGQVCNCSESSVIAWTNSASQILFTTPCCMG